MSTRTTKRTKTKAATRRTVDRSPRYTTKVERAPEPSPLVGTDPNEPGISAGERLARQIEAGALPEQIYLKVIGNGLRDEHILDADLVRVNTTRRPENGDATAILVDRQRRQLGRFHREKTGRIRLEMDRSLFRPFYYAPHRVLVEGVVEGVYRLYGAEWRGEPDDVIAGGRK